MVSADWPSIEWCAGVARSLGIPPEQLREAVRHWYIKDGKSPEEIKRILVMQAKARGHTLVFVGTRGGPKEGKN
jgi:hypothetical protein